MRTERDKCRSGQERDCGGGGGKRAPAAAHRQCDRNQQPELRLVGEKSEQDAGNERPAVELHERCAQERRREEAVLAVPDIDKNRRESEREQKPKPIASS